MSVHNTIRTEDINGLPLNEAAKQYIDLGWSLVPIPPGTKGPNGDAWNLPENLIVTKEQCTTIRRGWNLGVQLEESDIVVLDIDSVLYTKMIFDYFGLKYDDLLDGAPRIVGKQGHDKAIFKAPKDYVLKTHKLSWPGRSKDEKRITVIEFRGGAVQDVLPPSMHPDTNNKYAWRISPFDGIPELPKEILSIWVDWDKYKARLKNLCPWDQVEHKTPTQKPRKSQKQDNGVIQQYNDKHSIPELLHKYGYIEKGNDRWLSPFSSTGLAGVKVFDDGRVFTHHGSDPWECEHSLDAFDLFTQMEHGGNLQAALSDARVEFNIPETAILIEEGAIIADNLLKNIDKKKTITKTLPDCLTSIPGILQEVVDYYNKTAKKPQPQFAVSAALTLGSVIMGRRHVTDQNNYTSLYVANLGKTSAGKEHSITVIEEILNRAGIDEQLMGPPGYHSAGAVFTALENQPCHLAIIDEMGIHFQSNNLSGNSNKLDAQRATMEAFGRLGGVLRPMGYSKQTLTKEQKAKTEQKSIHHPAITMIGMSTPDTIYDNINLESIASGFIPRFIFVESVVGRQKSRRLGKKPEPSNDLIKWVRECFTAHEDVGNLSSDFGAQSPPDPVLIPFEPEALDLLDEYEEHVMKRQNELDGQKLAGLLGKTVEIAHRVALIVAVSEGHTCIYSEDTEWAINFVDYYSVQTEINMKKRVYGTDFEAACKSVAEYVTDCGVKGATEYEIIRACHKYRGLEPFKRTAVIQVLPSDYDIRFVNISHGTKGGRPRQAFISSQFIQNEQL